MDINITLRKINDIEFEKYCKWLIIDYAQDLIKAGLCNEENAIICSKAEFNFSKVLPNGKETENNFIYVIVNDKKEDIGLIWYEDSSDNEVFICDFLILEKFRRQGYGKQALFLIENEAKEKKFSRLGLNVYKFNKSAFSLYSSCGFIVFREFQERMYMVKYI